MTERARIEAAFEQAIEQDAVNRSAFLADLWASEPEIAAEVEQLLLAHDRSGGILEAPVKPARGNAPEERRIGPYRVVNELGRGGMGVVYLAERDDGQFRRRVAVKLLRNSPDAEELHHRFLAERQILATLDHPNIAQLIDGGVTDGRLPYLVMEYVEGGPITEFCDRQRLTIRERLQLFLDVCSAVHHAHRNLIIHRDLKPGNILVTQRGQVKLLDFGIAKLLNPGMTAIAAPVTRAAQRVLTPEYASPEQLRGDPLSTTSDVYALGVVLYELLTGSRPHESGHPAPHELVNRVLQEEPERPSAAVLRSPDTASNRDATPEHLSRDLRGDLDAIVMMALRKEPARRYGSADLLAQDIQRYFDGLPIIAHKGNRWYHVRKFVRRHRVAVTAAAIVATSLVGGAGIAVRQNAIAQQERDRAQQALAEAEQITEFLIGMFESNDPAQQRGKDVTAQDLLRRGQRQAEELRDHPLVQARMLEAIGRVYHATADYAQARALLERALSIREARLGVNHPDVAQTLSLLTETLRYQGRYVDADAAAQRALDIRVRAFGPDHPDVGASLMQAAAMAIFRADLDRAIDLTRRGVAVLERSSASQQTLAAALSTLGATLSRRGEYEEAERHLRRAIAINRNLGAEQPQLANSIMSLAYVLDELPGRASEVEALYREGMEMRRRTLGADHPLYAYALGDLSIFLQGQGRNNEALQLAQQHVDLVTQIFGAEHPRTAEALSTSARALHRVGRTSEAIVVARRSAELRGTSLGRDHNSYGAALHTLAIMLHAHGSTAEAEQLMHQAIAIFTNSSGGAESGLVALAYSDLGGFALDARRYKAAEQSLQHALRIYTDQRIRPAHKDYQNTLRRLVELYQKTGQPAEAARYRALLKS